MTDKVQKIRKEVEKLHGNPYYMMAVKDVLEILDMQEEPVSEDLEKVAIEICSKVLKGETVIIDGYEYVVLSDAEECFIAGAQWQKQQMMKNLPIWKKSKKLIEGSLLDRGILYIPRYMIELSELKKLPKED